MIKIDKRGQIGRILTSLPVLLIVIVIMAVFIALSYMIASFKGPEQQRAMGVIEGNLLPLQTIEHNDYISGSVIKGSVRSMWVLDSMLLFLDQKLIPYPIYSFVPLGSSDPQNPLVITSKLTPLDSNTKIDTLLFTCYYYIDKYNCYPAGASANQNQIASYHDTGYTSSIRFKYKDKNYIYESYFGKSYGLTLGGKV